MAHELSFTEGGDAEMMSVRETPWHKLGTILKSPPTAAEALVAAKLDWKVRLGKVYRKNQFGEIIEVDRYRLIEREDNERVLGIGTKDYTPLQNEKAFEIFNPLVDNGFATFETAGALRHGQTVWVQVKLNITDPRVTDVLGTLGVVPFAFIDNSHTGTRSVRLTESPERIVCMNTLIGARASATRSVKVVHSSKVEANLVDAARGLWKDLVDRYVGISTDFATLKGKYLDEAMFRELILNVAIPEPRKDGFATETRYDKAVDRIEERREAMYQLWEHGTGHTGDHSAWEAFNAFTEWFDHVRVTKRDYAAAVLDGLTPHARIFSSLLAAPDVGK